MALLSLLFAVLFGSIALVGCDSNEGAPPSARLAAAPESTPNRTAESPAPSASAEPEVDPAGASGDIRSDIDGFTTIDACVEAHKTLDPLVSDAVDAIGYDTLLRDACRTLDAAKSLDLARCDAIGLSALRNACVSTVAEIAGRADVCPWTSVGRPEDGRDAACVAVAARDPRLCDALLDAAARATCVAVTTHDVAACVQGAPRSGRERCTRVAKRWASAFPGARPGAPFVVAGRLHVEPEGAGDAGVATDVDFTPDVRGGVVVQESLAGARVVAGTLSPTGLDRLGLSPLDRGRFAVSLFVADASGVPAHGGEAPSALGAGVERAEILLPGRASLGGSQAGRELKATWTKFGSIRGSPIEVDVVGEVDDAAGRWKVRAHIATFVRDVVGPRSQVALDGGNGRP
jgi:hypothetical protein